MTPNFFKGGIDQISPNGTIIASDVMISSDELITEVKSYN